MRRCRFGGVGDGRFGARFDVGDEAPQRRVAAGRQIELERDHRITPRSGATADDQGGHRLDELGAVRDGVEILLVLGCTTSGVAPKRLLEQIGHALEVVGQRPRRDIRPGRDQPVRRARNTVFGDDIQRDIHDAVSTVRVPPAHPTCRPTSRATGHRRLAVGGKRGVLNAYVQNVHND